MFGGLVLFWNRQTARFSWRILGGTVFAFGAFVVLFNFLEPDKAFIIWASLALAFAAFLSFGESRQLRNDNVKRELRDRKERLLVEIIEWATDLAKVSFGSELNLIVGIDADRQKKIDVANRLARYQLLFTKSKGVETIVGELQKKLIEDDLSTPTTRAIGYLKAVMAATKERFENITDGDIVKQLEDVEIKLLTAATKLIETATKIRTKDIS